ncbi:MAG: hypothetical protein EOO92_16175 [Pedobacter sp.]|nr:MAG: hypothetical protein EOO92_16175 [Pedobacter sp.]
MNNTKKTVLGLLLAIITFGFSAFTSTKKTNIHRYYKTSLAFPSPTNTDGYTYYEDDLCSPNGDLCSAEWDITGFPAPSDGDPLPLVGVTFVPNSISAGHY